VSVILWLDVDAAAADFSR